MKRLLVFLIFCGIGLVPIILYFSAGAGKNDLTDKDFLLNSGFTQVQMLDHSWVGCSTATITGTNFIAISPFTHRLISGEVCTDWFGGHQLRIK